MPLDVRKAFDIYSHYSIDRAFFRVDIPAQIITYILNTFNSATTIILYTLPKFIKSVKQGDPLSPLLFNILIDELLVKLHRLPVGGTIGPNILCPAMVFANDLVLLEDDETQLPITLKLMSDFFSAADLKSTAQSHMRQFHKGVFLPEQIHLSAREIGISIWFLPIRHLNIRAIL